MSFDSLLTDVRVVERVRRGLRKPIQTGRYNGRRNPPSVGVDESLAFRFDPDGNLTGITDALDPARNQAFGYDALERLIEAEGRYGDLQYAYDPAGNRLSRIRNGLRRPRAAHQAHRRWAGHRLQYDAAGNLLRAKLADGASLHHRYDAAHRLVGLEDHLGHRIDYILDTLGNRLREDVMDPTGGLSRTRSRVYDEMNRLVREIGGENQSTLYAYDANGNRVSTTDPNGKPHPLRLRCPEPPHRDDGSPRRPDRRQRVRGAFFAKPSSARIAARI